VGGRREVANIGWSFVVLGLGCDGGCAAPFTGVGDVVCAAPFTGDVIILSVLHCGDVCCGLCCSTSLGLTLAAAGPRFSYSPCAAVILCCCG